MTLGMLPSELILYLGNFLPKSSLNALIRSTRAFAELLTPQLYHDEVTFQSRLHQDPSELDPYNLPLHWSHCVCRWHSDIILGFFRTRPLHVLTHTDEAGCTLLHMAARFGNTLLAEILIRRGLDINAKSKAGRTPLFDAISNEQEEMINFLLTAGADVTVVDSLGATVLEMTALFSRGAMLRCIVDIVEKCNKRPNDEVFSQSVRDKALHRAIYRGDELSVRTLLDYRADPSSTDQYGTTALACAACHGQEQIIHMLLDFGADPLPCDSFGRSAITCAAESNCSWNIVQRLFQAVVDAGGDITAGSPSNEHLTPLHCFATRGNLPAVELLLNHNADALMRTQEGVAPLHLALFHYSKDPSNYEGVCRLLIQAINSGDGDFDHTLPPLEPLRGGTSLHLAAEAGSENLVSLLLDSGVNVQVRDNDGHLALDIARLSGHQAVVQLLSGE